MHGDLSLESTEGVESSFTLTLPVGQGDDVVFPNDNGTSALNDARILVAR